MKGFLSRTGPWPALGLRGASPVARPSWLLPVEVTLTPLGSRLTPLLLHPSSSIAFAGAAH